MPTLTVLRGRRLVLEAGLFLGVGFAALLHGIVLRQLLGWHHVFDGATAQLQLFYDGLVALGALALVSFGVILLIQARSRLNTPRVPRRLGGAFLVGAGGYQVLEGLLAHHVLGIHHVNPIEDTLVWDLAFLAIGALLALSGVLILKRVAQEARDLERNLWPGAPPPRPRKAPKGRETGVGGLSRR